MFEVLSCPSTTKAMPGREVVPTQKKGDFLAALSSQLWAAENVLWSKPSNGANKTKDDVL